MKRFKIVLPTARPEAARAWDAELSLVLSADSRDQAVLRAKLVMGRQWPVGLAVRAVRVGEIAQ